jgi:hypothetical protein
VLNLNYHGFCSIECLNDYRLKQNYGCTGMINQTYNEIHGIRENQIKVSIDDILFNCKINGVIRLPDGTNIAIISDKDIDVGVFTDCCREFQKSIESKL